jgi:aerobic carbon-monoxide dehydrogenase large subunit
VLVALRGRQILGGFAQGLGGAVWEEIAYDGDGQIRNASFMDFLMPYATEIPLLHTETPSPLNPLGVKGVGEAGTIPVSAVSPGPWKTHWACPSTRCRSRPQDLRDGLGAGGQRLAVTTRS